ncbi:MAG: helix-turn-helix domain-containing protein [Polyangiales bacterium]
MYALRPVAPALRPFVEHYWFVRPDAGAPLDLRVDVFVDLRADLVFNFGAPYTRAVIGGASRRIRRATLDAQRLRPLRIVQRGAVHVVGVRFHLGGLAPFARVSLVGVTDTTPAPAAVLGPEARALEDALRAQPDLDERARILDAFFLRALSRSPGQERFARALAHLVDARGGAAVRELAAREQVTPRQIHRLFAQYLGVAPKTVAGVLRFQSALRALMRDPGCTLASLAAAHGFYDQAHFVREFKRYSGGLPGAHRGYFPTAMPTDFAPNMVSFVQDPSLA